MVRTIRVAVVCLSVLVAYSTTEVCAQDYSRVVVFGDSLSDTGNSFATTGIPPADAYYAGRFSNGPNWIDYLEQHLGLTEGQLLNFAVGGSSTGFGFKTPPDGIFETPPGTVIPTVGVQIQTYLATVGTSDPDQLTILWAGSNDLLTYNLPKQSINNIEAHVRALAASGADEFLIPGVSPLGSTPAVNGTFEGALLNYFSWRFNRLLNRRLDSLESELQIEIHRLDTYGLSWLGMNFPGLFGLTNTTDAALVDLAAGNVTPEQAGSYFYWDIIHPTSAVHQTLAAAAAHALAN